MGRDQLVVSAERSSGISLEPKGATIPRPGYARRVSFEDALHDLGFVFSRRGRGGETWEQRATPYLTHYLQVLEDGTALFTWELAIGELMAAQGLQVGSDEHLNTFLFPKEDTRGPLDAAWVSAQMDAAEERLRTISLLTEGP